MKRLFLDMADRMWAQHEACGAKRESENVSAESVASLLSLTETLEGATYHDKPALVAVGMGALYEVVKHAVDSLLNKFDGPELRDVAEQVLHLVVAKEQRKLSNIAQVIDYFVGVADAIVRAKVNMDKIDLDVVLDSEQMKDACIEDMQVATRSLDVLRNTMQVPTLTLHADMQRLCGSGALQRHGGMQQLIST